MLNCILSIFFFFWDDCSLQYVVKMNVLLICSYCTQKSKVKQKLYVLGMQIIFIAVHLKLFVSFDKDYLYMMNGLVYFLAFSI